MTRITLVPGILIWPPSKYLVGASVFFSLTKSTIEAFSGNPVLVTSLPSVTICSNVGVLILPKDMLYFSVGEFPLLSKSPDIGDYVLVEYMV